MRTSLSLLFSNRDVRRLVLADSASLTGDFMLLAAMPFVVGAVGGSGKQIGIALAVQAAALVLMLPLGGVIGDRVPRRSAMVAADLLRFGSQAAIALALITGVGSYWQLLFAQLLHGVGTGVFMPASNSIVPDVVTEAKIQTTNGLKQVARASAGLVGPALGAFAVSAASPGFALAADSATFGISAVALAGLPSVNPRFQAAAQTAASVSSDLRAGIHDFWACGWLRSVVLQFAVLNAFVLAPFFVLVPVVARESFGGAGAWAALLMTLGLGQLAGGAAALRWRPPRPLVVGAVAFAAWALPLILIATLAPLPFILASAVLAGFGQAIFDVLWGTTMQTQLPADRLARLSSFDQIGGLAIVPAGFAIGGLIAGTVGPTAGLLAGAGILLASTAAILAVPSVRGLKARSPILPMDDAADSITIIASSERVAA